MPHHTTLSILFAFTLTACDRLDSVPPEHAQGAVVRIRLTGEQVMVLRHAYPAFTYDDGVYDVRHSDGRISEVKPFEIEK